MNETHFRREEYAGRGDYHLKLNPNWSYYPTYLSKMKFVENTLNTISPDKQILDVGCGEGALVKKYRAKGYSIYGLDYNYGEPFIMVGSVTKLPIESNSFDVVLLLDVLEHLPFPDQEVALEEIFRILRPGGMFIFSIPNLAHLISRIKFMFWGRLGRTAKLSKHPGDRPVEEYIALLEKTGFSINRRVGITLSVPLLTSHLIWRHPTKFLWLHDMLGRINLPNLSFLNIMLCQK
ncbi:MAG: class I SAM-dependent methyltransferase [Ardenticatenaceae bacterium]|nr:class I SAM-dependent methyltransferase [Ardenticatenaceae bacterium]